MAKFRYIGECAAGEVVFHREGKKIVMPEGEAVEVPEWLAKKLAANNHFERVEDEAPPADGEGSDEAPPEKAPTRKGRKS